VVFSSIPYHLHSSVVSPPLAPFSYPVPSSLSVYYPVVAIHPAVDIFQRSTTMCLAIHFVRVCLSFSEKSMTKQYSKLWRQRVSRKCHVRGADDVRACGRFCVPCRCVQIVALPCPVHCGQVCWAVTAASNCSIIFYMARRRRLWQRQRWPDTDTFYLLRRSHRIGSGRAHATMSVGAQLL